MIYNVHNIYIYICYSYIIVSQSFYPPHTPAHHTSHHLTTSQQIHKIIKDNNTAKTKAPTQTNRHRHASTTSSISQKVITENTTQTKNTILRTKPQTTIFYPAYTMTQHPARPPPRTTTIIQKASKTMTCPKRRHRQRHRQRNKSPPAHTTTNAQKTSRATTRAKQRHQHTTKPLTANKPKAKPWTLDNPTFQKNICAEMGQLDNTIVDNFVSHLSQAGSLKMVFPMYHGITQSFSAGGGDITMQSVKSASKLTGAFINLYRPPRAA